MVLDMKISGEHFHQKMCQILVSWSLLKLDVFVFQFFKLWFGNRSGMCYMLGTFFLTFTSNMTSFSTIKHKLFGCHYCFSCFVWGFNYVSSICMGSSFGEGVNGGVDMGDAKFLCMGGNSKYFSKLCSKSWLSHWNICVIIWFKVVGFNASPSCHYIT